MKKSLSSSAWLVLFISIALIYSLVSIVGCGSNSNGSGSSGSSALTGVSSSGSAFVRDVFFDSLLESPNYRELHISVSHDGKKMFVLVNNTDVPFGTFNGTADCWIVDAEQAELGNIVKLAGKVTITTSQDPALHTFESVRSSWSPDGSRIFASGGDTTFVLDGNTLAVIGQATNLGGLNHDSLSTDDGQYSILTLRTKPYVGGSTTADDNYLDGELRLYSVAANSVIGPSVSVCNACHGQTRPRNATLCGVSGNLVKSGSVYTGTLYIAGLGGHVAKANVTVDPANTAAPITVNSLNRIIISSKKFSDGTSTHKLHDVRLEGNTLYWATLNTDENGKLHYGKVNADNGTGLVDMVVDLDPRTTQPALPGTPNVNGVYCASGLTANSYMSATMVYPAYVSVFNKSAIVR